MKIDEVDFSRWVGVRDAYMGDDFPFNSHAVENTTVDALTVPADHLYLLRLLTYSAYEIAATSTSAGVNLFRNSAIALRFCFMSTAVNLEYWHNAISFVYPIKLIAGDKIQVVSAGANFKISAAGIYTDIDLTKFPFA